MHELYEATVLTSMKVARTSGYIDWASQPSIFKHYPEFLFRYKFGENSALQMIELSRCITSSSFIGKEPYYKLSTPSAGNLHPLELYVQIRGVKGVLSGIYHVDAGNGELVLIQEIESDGLESIVGMRERFNGMIYIVSCVPFRSEWKYGERAIRYCYLDIGHQVAAIEVAATLNEQSTTILSAFDMDELNRFMGFSDEEFTCAVIAVGESSLKSVKTLNNPLIKVSPTDYSQRVDFFADEVYKKRVLKNLSLPSYQNISKSDILNRRSARRFEKEGLDRSSFDFFMNLLKQPFYPLITYTLVLKDDVLSTGIYLDGEILKEGNFSDEISKILVDQSFVKDASIITIITSKHFSANKLMLAGAYVHKLYLEAQKRDIGCTGIGAFYDKKLQGFLEIKDYILYVCAIGKEKR